MTLKRTRKWAFVKQEAARLAALGETPLAISKALGVNKSTVTRWMAAGKLAKTTGEPERRTLPSANGKTPAEWAATVRAAYDLDATDDQLVELAELALECARDRKHSVPARMTASGRFQALTRQLSLVTRGGQQAPPAAEGAPPAEEIEKPAARVVPRRSGGDPRKLLMAVK